MTAIPRLDLNVGCWRGGDGRAWVSIGWVSIGSQPGNRSTRTDAHRGRAAAPARQPRARTVSV